MEMILHFLLLLSTFNGVPASGAVWGGDGHRLVCEIAWRYLTPQARAFVTALRQGESGTFPESCTWADEIRDERPETYNYHFINIPPRLSGMDWQRDCGDPAKRCAPWAIRHYTVILADSTKSATERLDALRFVSHFVGDLHQPLHAGRPADRGGNDIVVSFFGDRGTSERPVQLHSIWDSRIMRRAGLRWPQSAEDLVAGIAPADVAAWSNSDVVGWANESYRIDEELAYTAPPGSDVEDAYYLRALPVVKQRLRQAGVRLAHLLNEAARGRTSFTF